MGWQRDKPRGPLVPANGEADTELRQQCPLTKPRVQAWVYPSLCSRRLAVPCVDLSSLSLELWVMGYQGRSVTALVQGHWYCGQMSQVGNSPMAQHPEDLGHPRDSSALHGAVCGFTIQSEASVTESNPQKPSPNRGTQATYLLLPRVVGNTDCVNNTNKWEFWHVYCHYDSSSGPLQL